MLRRRGLMAAGLATAMSFGLVGVGTGSAAALKVKNESTWSFESKFGCGEMVVFYSGGGFASDTGGDNGMWSGGGKTISMIWTGGNDEGQSFTGHFVSTTSPQEYKGKEFLGGSFVGRAMLVKGNFC